MGDSPPVRQTPSGVGDSSHTIFPPFISDSRANVLSIVRWLHELEKSGDASREHKQNFQRLTALMNQFASDNDVAGLTETSQSLTKALAEYNASQETTMQDAKQAARQHCKAFFKGMEPLIGFEGLRECLRDAFPQQQAATPARSPDAAADSSQAGHEPERPSTNTTTPPTEVEDDRAFELIEARVLEDVGVLQAEVSATKSALASMNKRPLSATEPDASGPSKRQDTGADTDEPGTIAYNKVFQDGDAEIKYHIIEEEFKNPVTNVEGGFWILRCDEHNLHYANSTGDSRWILAAASKHLIKTHKLPGDYKGVLKEFGVAVRGCSPGKAKDNNDSVVDACLNGGYEPRTTMNRRQEAAGAAAAAVSKQKATARRSKGSGGSRRPGTYFSGDNDSDDVFGDSPSHEIPIPGHLYLAFWIDENGLEDWYAAVCLPVGGKDFSSVGLGVSLKTSGLLAQMPKCYEYDRTREKVVGWKPGYKYGDRLANKRKYPFFFFDSDNHFISCGYGWVPADNIAPFDLYGFNKKYLSTLQTYLQQYYQPPNAPRSLLPSPTRVTSKSTHSSPPFFH